MKMPTCSAENDISCPLRKARVCGTIGGDYDERGSFLEEKEMDLTEILEETTALVEIDREGNPIYDEGDDEEDVCDDAYWESLKDTDEEVAEMNKEYGF